MCRGMSASSKNGNRCWATCEIRSAAIGEHDRLSKAFKQSMTAIPLILGGTPLGTQGALSLGPGDHLGQVFGGEQLSARHLSLFSRSGAWHAGCCDGWHRENRHS